jgi:hypothetical protein
MANLAKPGQNLSLFREDQVHLVGCTDAVRLDKFEDCMPILSCRPGPNQIHHADLG